MNISANTSSSLAAQQSHLKKTADSIGSLNRESAHSASKIDLAEDRVEIRNKASEDFPLLDQQNLISVLEQLSGSFNQNSEELITAQGNLNHDSVLALLND